MSNREQRRKQNAGKNFYAEEILKFDLSEFERNEEGWLIYNGEQIAKNISISENNSVLSVYLGWSKKLDLELVSKEGIVSTYKVTMPVD